MARPEVQYATTADGVSIAFYEMGEGPPLVLPSSVLWSHLRMRTIPEYLRDGSGIGRFNRIIRYDSRGTGLSDRSNQDMSLEAKLRDLEAVVDKLGLDRFDIMALGHAGVVGIAYAARHPSRVGHLVLINAYAAGSYFTGTSRFRALRSFQDELRAVEDLEENWERYTLYRAHENIGFSDSELAQRLAPIYREAMTPSSLLQWVESLPDLDVRPLLGQVRVPTLALHIQLAVFPIDWVREIASGIPGCRFVQINRDKSAEGQWWDERIQTTVEKFLGVGVSDAATQDADVSPGPSALRTVLFTDLVGHTEMMQRLGDDRGRDVLREHERITREVLKANGGTEVKTMGDGFMASFGSVTKAVECAVALQRAFAEREGEPLSVRVGLNAGEPIEEDGDLFGATVILASRSAAKADGGEILVADTVRGLCSGKGFLFADRGEFVAKGIEEPVRVYEVSWRG